MRIDSSNGSIFKNSGVATTLTVVILVAGEQIDTEEKMKSRFGQSAYLEWECKRYGETEYTVIPREDKRLSDGGFIFTLVPEDVDVKSTFNCSLNY